MKIFSSFTLLLLFLACVAVLVHGNDYITCTNKKSPCFLKKIKCPDQCPTIKPKTPKAKACYFKSTSPICKTECKHKKPNCNGHGAACHDPRFIGGDGIVFYFHGKSNQHFTLVSDPSLQINARFIGLRPIGRQRDFTWIQALGILFGSHTFSIEATKAAKWDQDVDHLKFFYDDSELVIPEGYSSVWESSENNIQIERTTNKNSVLITFPQVAEISINVVPVTKEDDRIHKYNLPSDDCFAHLEVQFQFFDLSKNVEGILGRTYQPDFVNPAKPGVAMAIVGGEDMYRTSSLMSPDCARCMFSPDQGDNYLNEEEDNNMISKERIQGSIDCTSGSNSGIGIFCRK